MKLSLSRGFYFGHLESKRICHFLITRLNPVNPVNADTANNEATPRYKVKCSCACVSFCRRAGGGLPLWPGGPGEDLPQRHGLQGVLDRTQLRHHQLRQHPVCHPHRFPVHHDGGLGGHPLQRKSTHSRKIK